MLMEVLCELSASVSVEESSVLYFGDGVLIFSGIGHTGVVHSNNIYCEYSKSIQVVGTVVLKKDGDKVKEEMIDNIFISINDQDISKGFLKTSDLILWVLGS